MRILHTEASSGWGGQEIRIVTESQIFAQHGHEVFIVADQDSQLAQRAPQYGIRTISIPLKKKRWQEFTALRRVLQELKPDVISCHSSTDHWLSALALKTVQSKIALVRTRHISTPVTRNLPTKWLYNTATNALMTTGQSIREALIVDKFVEPSQVTSVPTGIDTQVYLPGNQMDSRKKLGLPTNKYIFGIVAALRSWKGHTYLIEAFNQLGDDHSILLIVGDGGQMTAYQALAKQSPMASNIQFVGHQSNVIPYLQAMDCFVLPSYANEGIPQALLQAMAIGLPIVSCPIGGIPECLEGYANQHQVEPKNVKALTHALQLQKDFDTPIKRTRIRYTPHTLDSLYQNSLSVYQTAIASRLNI